MRVRRLRKEAAGLDVTAFINLIIVLVPFLLSTAVFSQLAIHELSLPAQSSGALEKLKENNLQLEVVIRSETIEVGDRIGGLIQRIDKAGGTHDFKTLAALMRSIKERFPQATAVSVLPEPAVPYDVVVQAMDAVRSGRQVQGTRVVAVDLFPEVSVGDAPVRGSSR
jgi:biopolymer transport protein ExbD